MNKSDVRRERSGALFCFLLTLAVAAALGTADLEIQASSRQPLAPRLTELQEVSSPDPEDLARGQRIVESACSICHDYHLVEEQRLSREDWGYVIQAMLTNGSDLSDREIPFALDYLSTAFPVGGEQASEQD